MSDEIRDWKLVTQELPLQGVTVETKIDDGKGIRNVTKLRLFHSLWFLPDGSMYVYYTPTHWRLP